MKSRSDDKEDTDIKVEEGDNSDNNSNNTESQYDIPDDAEQYQFEYNNLNLGDKNEYQG